MTNQRMKPWMFCRQWVKGLFPFVLALCIALPGVVSAAPKETLVSATVDVIVAIDTTGSMSGWIRQVRSETTEFANQLDAEGFDYRLGLLDFKDIHRDGGPWWYDFTDRSSTFNSWVSRLDARGGGDWEESDINAMYNAYRHFEREGRSTAGRMLILITDAPFIRYENGYNIERIAKLLNDNNIVLNIIGSGADAWGQARELDELTRGEYYSTEDLEEAYEGLIDQIQKNTPPKVEESEVSLPPGVDPGSIDTSTELEFSLIGADVDGDVLRYYWEALSPSERDLFLGDTPTIRVRLTEPGVWEVTGTVTDPTGESVSVTHRIAVGNRKPSISNLRINSPNTTTPKIIWDFSDPDGHPQEKAQIRVKRGGTVVWNSGKMGTSNAFGRVRGMEYGGDYIIEAQAMDRYDAWSDWERVSVHINELPDLRPINLTTVPDDAVLNQDRVTVKVQVKNEGEQTAGTFRVSLYDDGNLVNRQTVSEIRRGDRKEVSFRFKAVNPKTHTLKAVVDSKKQVSEGNERNNAITKSIRVLHRVDLIPQISFLPDETVPQGGTYTARMAIKNVGQGAAGSFRVDVYQNGTRMLQKTLDHMNAGATNTFDIKNLPANEAGKQTFKVVVDAADRLREANEENNTIEANVQITASKNVTDLRFTKTPDGRRITVHWEEPTGAFFDHVNLSMVPVGTSEETSIRVEKGVQRWTFDSLAPKTAYLIRVVAFNTVGTPSAGITKTVTTPRDSVPPGDVNDLAVTPIPTGGALKVTWKDPTVYDFKEVLLSYRPERGTFGEPIVVEKGTQQFVLDELIDGDVYEIQLSTVDVYRNVSSGKRVLGTPKDVVPAGEVQDVDITSGPQGRSIQVQWVDPGDMDYEFTELRLFKEDGVPVGKPIRVEKGRQQYEFQGVEPSTDFMIQFQTLDISGNRSTGIKLPFRTADDTIPPGPIQNLKVTADKQSGTLKLKWTDPVDDDLDKVFLFIKEDQEEAEWIEVKSIKDGVESALLKPEPNHHYVVRAIAVDDQGNRSEPVKVRATLLFPKPLKPIDVRFNKWGESQVIQWREAGNISPVTYKLYRQISGEEELKEIATLPPGTTRYVDHFDRETGQKVDYYVSAVDSDGTESNLAGPVGPTVSFNDSPILRFVDSTSTQVKLTNTPVKGAQEYTLQRHQSGEWDEVGKKRITGEPLFWIDREVEPGQRYQYRVIAHWDETRAISFPIFVTVPASEPTKPTNLVAKVDGDFVRLSWQPPKEGAEAYNLYRQKDDGPILLVKSRFEGGTEYVDNSIDLDATYTYYVSVWQDGVESEKSASANVRISQTPPSGWGKIDDDPKEHVGDYINVEQMGESVRVSWKVAEGTPAHYFVYRQETGSLYHKLIAVLTGDRLRFVDSTTKVGITYMYAVQAQYRETFGSTLTPRFEADPIRVDPSDGISPYAVFDPDDVRASVDDEDILLTWEVPKAAKEYLIYRKGSDEPVSKLIGRVRGREGTLFVDTPPTSGATYEYLVIARYPAGNSAMVKSNAISIP